MTVAELIEELKKLPPDMEVCGDSEVGTWELTKADIVPIIWGGKDAVSIGYSH